MHATHRVLAVLVSLTLAAGCKDLNVPDLNNGDLNDLQLNPTAGAVNTLAHGLLYGTRQGIAAPNGYVSLLGILGRESYNFDAADPRFVTEMLIGPLDGGSPAFGGNLWAAPYANIRSANILLNALDQVVGLSDEELAGLRGFAQTIQALDYLNVISTRDDLGAPIDVDRDAVGDPAPIATKAEVFTYIVTLLDDADTELGNAGSGFSFSLTTGFAGFDTPATFRQFNRALRARVAAYLADWNGVLTALGGSFVSTTASLDLGVYHVFSTGSGDVTNGLYDPSAADLLGHPSLTTDAQQQAGGAPDARYTSKTFVLGASKTVQGITTDLGFQMYGSPAASVPIIRNEELILLRAEANLGLNQDATALTDINEIRTTSGGLTAIVPGTWIALSDTEQLDELLYNRRYSLLFEGGHRWIDMRRYGRLAQLPLALASHNLFTSFPFPIGECLARSPEPAAGC